MKWFRKIHSRLKKDIKVDRKIANRLLFLLLFLTLVIGLTAWKNLKYIGSDWDLGILRIDSSIIVKKLDVKLSPEHHNIKIDFIVPHNENITELDIDIPADNPRDLEVSVGSYKFGDLNSPFFNRHRQGYTFSLNGDEIEIKFKRPLNSTLQYQLKIEYDDDTLTTSKVDGTRVVRVKQGKDRTMEEVSIKVEVGASSCKVFHSGDGELNQIGGCEVKLVGNKIKDERIELKYENEYIYKDIVLWFSFTIALFTCFISFLYNLVLEGLKQK